MDRVILHSDLNNFYASVECLHNPNLQGKAVAVCGDAELRHGIVLAKNYKAKSYGIKTGDVIWEARQKCRELVVISANFPLYLRFSRLARKIYEDYTDRIESFGIDECWLDVTESVNIYGSGEKIADEIRNRMISELGITASVGVSFNKIFAKLGSDMKKPNATTVINKDNYKEKIYNLPASDLLYVGRATYAKLLKYNIKTIGDIARSDIEFLKSRLGKWGEYLWIFANGYDQSIVSKSNQKSFIKSVGNSTTTFRDLYSEDDAFIIITILAESVAARLREQWLKGQVISLFIQDNNFARFNKQIKINEHTFLSKQITDTSMYLFKNFYSFKQPIRNIGIKVSELVSADIAHQSNIFKREEDRLKEAQLEFTIDDIRRRFGHVSIQRGIMFTDTDLSNFNPKIDNIIHPYSFFK